MRLMDERTGLEVLGRDECQQLLEAGYLGRIGVCVAERPVIMPVNYAMHQGDVIFRTDEGTKFDAAVRGNFVAFEIDAEDPTYQTGWSVLVTGVAEEIKGEEQLAELQALPLRSWGPGPKAHFMRITPVTMTGRRILREPPT